MKAKYANQCEGTLTQEQGSFQLWPFSVSPCLRGEDWFDIRGKKCEA